MAGSVHNVNDYAPHGYVLAATHYADGKCTHVFSADGQRDVELVVSQHEDEREALERFKASHSLPAPKPVKRSRPLGD